MHVDHRVCTERNAQALEKIVNLRCLVGKGKASGSPRRGMEKGCRRRGRRVQEHERRTLKNLPILFYIVIIHVLPCFVPSSVPVSDYQEELIQKNLLPNTPKGGKVKGKGHVQWTPAILYS